MGEKGKVGRKAFDNDGPYAREIQAFCELAVKKVGARSVILFGSMATGRYGVGSDVDILVVSESLPEGFLDRLRVLSELNETNAPIEAVGYTSEEFFRMLERRHPTALFAVAEGRPLYDDGFFAEARRRFERVRLKFDLVRTDRGWDARKLSSKASM